MRSTKSRGRFSYVDDIVILGIGRTITGSVAAAQTEVNDCSAGRVKTQPFLT